MEKMKMIVSLTLICGICGFLLASVNSMTKVRIEEQILKYVQMPAVETVLASSNNNLLSDRKKVIVDGNEIMVFIGKKGGKIWSLAYEKVVDGAQGKLGVMIGVDVDKDIVTGIGITTCYETPGIGTRIKEDNFKNFFKGRSVTENMALKKDKGVIDAITGATISSQATCNAVQKGVSLYQKIKAEVIK